MSKLAMTKDAVHAFVTLETSKQDFQVPICDVADFASKPSQSQQQTPTVLRAEHSGPQQTQNQPPPFSQSMVSWQGYESKACWDEMMDGRTPRVGCEGVTSYLASLTMAELTSRQRAAELAIEAMGITFTVYSEQGGIDRSWPFDVIPRVIPLAEWTQVSAGLVQRLKALNMFINDLYGDQAVIKDGVFPAELLLDSVNFRPECVGMKPAFGTWAHICGSDLVRGADGTLYVLEDNLRVPSGVSYMLQNRQVTKRVFADLFRDLGIHPVDAYPNRLLETLASLSPRKDISPTIALLTPGVFNSAYFEHTYLAQQMGIHLVEGSDLMVDADDCVYMSTIAGPERVDVIYRRVDDLFLDPEVFRKDSTLGVAGLMRAWRAGNVAIANAPGAGVADDKVVYSYVPALIKYYLGEEAIIPNVDTYLMNDVEQRDRVFAKITEFVLKPANESGGYGVFVGSRSTLAEADEVKAKVIADPRNWIAQPIISLSTAPTLVEGNIVPRHLDLRPFILSGEHSYVTQGGLTRVALREGSLVVNSSQGGGSKDTWVVGSSSQAYREPSSLLDVNATGHEQNRVESESHDHMRDQAQG
jgi:uncharacterized circularly permuted ATP-grasp superfamily protein